MSCRLSIMRWPSNIRRSPGWRSRRSPSAACGRSTATNEAVRGIDFEVAPGEVFGFLGPNGAGKTTTVEILEGYRERTGGRRHRPRHRPRAPHPRVAHPDRPGPAGVRAQPAAHGRRDHAPLRELLPERASRWTRRSSWSGSASKRGARVGSLSGGQQRRLDVGVGIIGNPELLFLDEPTTGLRSIGQAGRLEHDRGTEGARHHHRPHDPLHGGGPAPRGPRGDHA